MAKQPAAKTWRQGGPDGLKGVEFGVYLTGGVLSVHDGVYARRFEAIALGDKVRPHNIYALQMLTAVYAVIVSDFAAAQRALASKKDLQRHVGSNIHDFYGRFFTGKKQGRFHNFVGKVCRDGGNLLKASLRLFAKAIFALRGELPKPPGV